MAGSLLQSLQDPQLANIPDAPVDFEDTSEDFAPEELNLSPPQNTIQKAQGTKVPTFQDAMRWLDEYDQKDEPAPATYGSTQPAGQPLRGMDVYRNLVSGGDISGSEFNRVTGRVSGYAQQSSRDTTPSGRGITPGRNATGGFSDNWASFFQGHMAQNPEATRPAGGWSWESTSPKVNVPAHNNNLPNTLQSYQGNVLYQSPI